MKKKAKHLGPWRGAKHLGPWRGAVPQSPRRGRKFAPRRVSRSFTPGDFKLLVKRSSAGLGLYAGEKIPKGACIIEYVGRVISKAEEYTSKSKYLFEVHSRMTIDGKPKWNKAGYINHSCKPNAEPEIRNRRIFIMAKRSIAQGEEILYDYGKEYWDDHIKPRGCRCVPCRTV